MSRSPVSQPLPRSRSLHHRSDSISKQQQSLDISSGLDQLMTGTQLLRGGSANQLLKQMMSSSDMIPKSIGNFILRSTLKETQNSIYKLATPSNEPTQKYTCRIVDRKKLEAQSSVSNRFEAEVKILQKVQNPYTLGFYDFMRDKFFYYMIIDYCPKTLFDMIMKGPIPENQAAVLFKRICRGVQFLHENGVVHRDLKPENIMMTDDGMPKITSFVLSKLIEGDDVLVSTPCGSPSYASPEKLSGKPYDGKISDIWSLGVILYTMVVGSLPWTGRQRSELFTEIKSGQYKIPPSLSDPCKSLISSMLCIDAEKRININDILAHPFLQIKLTKKTRSSLGSSSSNFLNLNTLNPITLEKIESVFNQDDSAIQLSHIDGVRQPPPLPRPKSRPKP